MFERFAADARTAVTDAQTVARATHSPTIDSSHLLVAIASQSTNPARRALEALGVNIPDLIEAATRSEDDLDAEALAAVGIDLAAVTKKADEAFGVGALTRASGRGRTLRGHIAFTKEAKKTLEISLREAIRQGGRSIDSRHLLLAITRQGDTRAYRVLADALARADAGAGAGAGATVSDLRRTLDAASGSGRNDGDGPASRVPVAS